MWFDCLLDIDYDFDGQGLDFVRLLFSYCHFSKDKDAMYSNDFLYLARHGSSQYFTYIRLFPAVITGSYSKKNTVCV